MSYTILSHVATGDLATASLHNALLDNLLVLKTSINDDGTLKVSPIIADPVIISRWRDVVRN